MRLLHRLFLLVFFVLGVSILDVFPELSWAIDKEPAKSEAIKPSEEALLQQGKFQEVIDQLSPKLPELDAQGLKYLGRAYSGVKNSVTAIKTFNLALSKNAKDAEASTLVGLELLSTGKDREAMISFREALKSDPKYEPAYLAIEKIYIKKNNKYELRMLYSDMIDLLGEKPAYVTRLCELLCTSGLYDDAKKMCRRGIAVKRDEPKNYIYLALTHKEQGDKELATALFKKTVDLFKNSEEAQVAYAQFLDGEKNFVEAAKFYKAALDLNPESLRGQIGFAMASLEIQNYQNTFDALDKACRMDRRSIKEVRRAMGVLRVMKADKWMEKFEALSEKCGLPSYESKSTN